MKVKRPFFDKVGVYLFGVVKFKCKPLQRVGGLLTVNDCKLGVDGCSKYWKKL